MQFKKKIVITIIKKKYQKVKQFVNQWDQRVRDKQHIHTKENKINKSEIMKNARLTD